MTSELDAATPGAGAGEVVLAARNVSKYYGEEEQRVLVLDNISLELRAGEFIALLGPSGSGKSTLLRLLAGLLSPSRGQVLLRGGQPLQGANPQVAIVFQSFALYPWLTVLENVELGLLAKNVPADERRRLAEQAIDLIGLDGFESAYPRELSGGMKQRVGFARALVVEPEVLFMDEPFSALDVLVAENLRHELLDLWEEHKIPTRAILMVTHNIDEAVSMADRLLVFGANPGRVRAELAGLAPQARENGKSDAHVRLVDTIYRIMTNPEEDISTLLPGQPSGVSTPAAARGAPAFQMLPHVGVDELTGFIERLYDLGGREDLYDLARDLQMEADELLPLAEAADMLGFGDIVEGDVLLMAEGIAFAEAGVQEEKTLFRQQVLPRIVLLGEIMDGLRAEPDHRLREDHLLEQLQAYFSPAESRRQLDTAIDWGRYAELFSYDDEEGEFFLEEDAATSSAPRKL
jgi:NitT/TauT family transport system ATP-binding protein